MSKQIDCNTCNEYGFIEYETMVDGEYQTAIKTCDLCGGSKKINIGGENVNKQADFGSYAAHQPNYEQFKQMGALNDYMYQSLVHIGDATHKLSWALTVIENVKEPPADLMNDIRHAMNQIHEIQDRLRDIRESKSGGLRG